MPPSSACRARQSLLALIVLLSGCGTALDATAPNADRALTMYMSPQTAVGDAYGAILQIDQLRLSVEPTPLPVKACLPRCPTSVVDLVGGGEAMWTRWPDSSSAVDSVGVAFVQPPSDKVLGDTAVLAVEGQLTYLDATLTLVTVPFVLTLPRPGAPIWLRIPQAARTGAASDGRGYRVVLDPIAWLLDAGADTLYPILPLTKRHLSMEDPVVQALWGRVNHGLRLEPR